MLNNKMKAFLKLVYLNYYWKQLSPKWEISMADNINKLLDKVNKALIGVS